LPPPVPGGAFLPMQLPRVRRHFFPLVSKMFTHYGACSCRSSGFRRYPPLAPNLHFRMIILRLGGIMPSWGVGPDKPSSARNQSPHVWSARRAIVVLTIASVVVWAALFGALWVVLGSF